MNLFLAFSALVGAGLMLEATPKVVGVYPYRLGRVRWSGVRLYGPHLSRKRQLQPDRP